MKDYKIIEQIKTLTDEQKQSLLFYMIGYCPNGITTGIKYVKKVYPKNE